MSLVTCILVPKVLNTNSILNKNEYADDCVIFCKSPRAAERVCESIAKFIEGKLFLKVSREKTHVGSVHGQKFLGYSFNM